LRSAETESIQLPREGRGSQGCWWMDGHRVAGQGLSSCSTTLSHYRQATDSHCLQAVHTDTKQTVGCYIEDSDCTHSLVLQSHVSHKLWVLQGTSASHPRAILPEPLRWSSPQFRTISGSYPQKWQKHFDVVDPNHLDRPLPTPSSHCSPWPQMGKVAPTGLPSSTSCPVLQRRQAL
jgi:hypothetical protein